MSRSESITRVLRYSTAYGITERADVLAVEEPLEIRVNGRPLAVTMRTPSEDFALAAGFLLSEGIITSPEQIHSIRYCGRDFGPGAAPAENTVDVTLHPWVSPPPSSQERKVLMSSACGMCGRTSLDQVHQKACFTLADDPLEITASFLLSMPEILREKQRVFERTGGLHAAGLFDARSGDLVTLCEDVGRHNAVDKVVGRALLDGCLPLRGHALMVSGRASFELAQKARMAGLPMLASVSAPSSLAVELAQEAGMTLAGFVRSGRFVLYSGAQRVALSSPSTQP